MAAPDKYRVAEHLDVFAPRHLRDVDSAQTQKAKEIILRVQVLLAATAENVSDGEIPPTGAVRR
jgi:hypothetical protein